MVLAVLSLALVASGPKPVHLGNDSFTLARETKKSDPRDCCGGTQCKARCLEEKSFACFLYDDICPSRLSQSIFPEYALFFFLVSCTVLLEHSIRVSFCFCRDTKWLGKLQGSRWLHPCPPYLDKHR